MNKKPVFLGLYTKILPEGSQKTPSKNHWHVWSLPDGQFLVQEVNSSQNSQGAPEPIGSAEFFNSFRVHAAFSAKGKPELPKRLEEQQKPSPSQSTQAALNEAALERNAQSKAALNKMLLEKTALINVPLSKTLANEDPQSYTTPNKVLFEKAALDKAALDKARLDKARLDKAPLDKTPLGKAALSDAVNSALNIFDEEDDDDDFESSKQLKFTVEEYDAPRVPAALVQKEDAASQATFFRDKSLEADLKNHSPEPFARDLEKLEQQMRSEFSLALIRLQSNRDLAIENLSKIAENQANFSKEHKFMFTDFGTALRRRKLYVLACRFHERANVISPDDEHILFNMARAFFDSGRIDKARSCLEQAVAMASDFQAGSDFLDFIDGKKLRRR